jgi:hypothetical protein
MARAPTFSPFHVTEETLASLDAYIRELEDVGKQLPIGMDMLIGLMARADYDYSRALSLGVKDPKQQYPAQAWQIPVRRISSRYHQGWRITRVMRGVWRVYNDAREAWYIEYGIHTSPRRVIRPVRRRALMLTLKFVDQTRAGERVWDVVFGPMRRHSGTGPRLGLLRSPAFPGSGGF